MFILEIKRRNKGKDARAGRSARDKTNPRKGKDVGRGMIARRKEWYWCLLSGRMRDGS